MTISRLLRAAVGLALGLTTSLSLAQPESSATSPVPADRPTTAPAPATADDAAEILARVREAYRTLESLEVTGTLTTDFEVAGRVQKSQQPVYGAYLAPGRFRHRLADQLEAGSTGDKAYLLSVRRNAALMGDAPPEDAPTSGMPEPLLHLLRSQNPSLLLALGKDPVDAIAGSPAAASKAEDEKLDGKRYTALVLSLPREEGRIVALVDKETHLLRRISADMKAGLDKAGVAGVRSARYVLDYARIRPGAALNKRDFAWTPPENVKQLSDSAGEAEADRATTAPLAAP